MPTTLRARASAAVALAGAAVLLLAGPASAHITIGADENHQGASDAVLTFRVPNEKDGQSTVKVTVSFPTKTPLASVKPEGRPGWTVSTKTVKFDPPITTDDGAISDGVGEVTWTATSAATGIPSGGFGAFQVLVGPIPDGVDTLTFPTVQTYSDGSSVAWIEPTPEGGAEPEHPAPELALMPAKTSAGEASPGSSPAAGASEQASPAAAPSVEASPAPSAAAASSSGSSTATASSSGSSSGTDGGNGTALGVAGLVLGAAGAVLGGVAFLRTRKAAPTA